MSIVSPATATPPGAARVEPSTRPVRVALVAGETSGDLLGAGLIAQLRERFPHAQFAGIGGDAMRNAGCETWFDASELSLMGLVEVLRHLPRLLKLRKELRERLLAWQPDVFIGIDAPDFNLGVEKWLKQRGIRTVHYVSPSVWAWKEKRAEKIGASADMVLCLFPMEPPIYARHGVDARFVGHPMADDIDYQVDREAARAALGISSSSPVLAVLPGSRLGEVNRLAETFFEAAWQTSEKVPGLHVLVPAANAAVKPVLAEQLSRSALPMLRSHLLDGRARAASDRRRRSLARLGHRHPGGDAGQAADGGRLQGRATHRAYRQGAGPDQGQALALPNILAGEDLAPELIQQDCTSEQVAAAVVDWFTHPQKVAALQSRYLQAACRAAP